MGLDVDQLHLAGIGGETPGHHRIRVALHHHGTWPVLFEQCVQALRGFPDLIASRTAAHVEKDVGLGQ